jgi:cytochrome c1
MVPPLQPDRLRYEDGTPGTVEQYAKDVTAFLAWASDPKLEERKRIGLLVMGYLLITAVLVFFAKRRMWARVH